MAHSPPAALWLDIDTSSMALSGSGPTVRDPLDIQLPFARIRSFSVIPDTEICLIVDSQPRATSEANSPPRRIITLWTPSTITGRFPITSPAPCLALPCLLTCSPVARVLEFHRIRISTAPTSHTTVVLAPAPKASLVTHCNSQSLDASVATLFGHLADTYRLYLTQTLAEVRMRVTAVTNDRPHADIVERAVRQRIERTHTFAAKIQRLQAACEREFGLLSER
nr:hypothetical protein HK105_001226 [Polyrhizophydium stewartii]